MGERTMWLDRHRRAYPPWVTLDRVIADSWKLPRNEEGRGFPRPSKVKALPVLRAGAGDDVCAGAGLVPDLAADGALDAVRDRVGRLDEELGRDDGRVVSLQQRDGHAGVACGSAGAGVVGVVGLDRRDGGANVGLGGRVGDRKSV